MRTGEHTMRDEILRLCVALAKAERERDKARKSRDGWHAVACADAGKLAAAERERDALRAQNAETFRDAVVRSCDEALQQHKHAARAAESRVIALEALLVECGDIYLGAAIIAQQIRCGLDAIAEATRSGAESLDTIAEALSAESEPV